jgi:hypothetical protein
MRDGIGANSPQTIGPGSLGEAECRFGLRASGLSELRLPGGMGNRVVGVAIGGAQLHRYAAVALLDVPENQWQSFADYSIEWLV